MTAAPGQNATVEEILASIRQAISDDDAKRTNERLRSDPQALAEKKPVTNGLGDKAVLEKPVVIEDEVGGERLSDLAVAEAAADQDFIEQAIEQALNGVRAELENAKPVVKPNRLQPPKAAEVGAVAAGGQRAVPRAARTASVRREPATARRALLSPQTDASVSASFESLAKAMMGGDTRKLDEVVEELLRPMLRTWLESNLPQMVERLVREEIERVSRGPR